MGSGVIYAVIIGMWAAYFIPLLVRRHEQLSENRSVERFSRAMRTLSRKNAPSDAREVLMPRREGARLEVTVKRRVVSEAVQQQSRRSRALIRRRRILAVLLLTTVLTAVPVALGVLPWWGLLRRCRPHAGLPRAPAAHGYRHARGRTVPYGGPRAGRVARPPHRRRVEGGPGSPRPLGGGPSRAPRRLDRLAADHAARLAKDRAAEAAEAWSPQPVHVPTYVTKPRAPGPDRRLDLDRILAEEEAIALQRHEVDPVIEHFAETTVDHEVDDAELDAIIERRRAVND